MSVSVPNNNWHHLVFWNNVGREHKDLELGQLFSLAATTAACLLWTIPVTFVSSLSSVEGLRQAIPAVGKTAK